MVLVRRYRRARMTGGKASHPECHFLASGVAAVINFPLWRAAAIGQSGFKEIARTNKNFLERSDSPILSNRLLRT